MIDVVVTGAAGRMGSQIIRSVRASEGLRLTGATERPGFAPGADAGVVAGIGPIGVALQSELTPALAPRADVVIDFTVASAAVCHTELCAERGVAIVLGATGIPDETKEQIRRLSAKIPVVLSPNYAVGVNVMFGLVRQAAALLGDAFDAEILEMHHKLKKDSPSGTAEGLAEVLVEALGRKRSDLCYARHGIIGERPPKQIGVQALRGGDVVGDHTVFFAGEGERLEITHRATSRAQFANGAVRAAQWIVGKKPGMYDMQDVLGLRR
jgi:4-hydroxy-tetrahydrodipicolinate reductase